MTQIHLRDGSAIAHLRRASLYVALAALIALAVAAAAKVMQGQAPAKVASQLTATPTPSTSGRSTTATPSVMLSATLGENADSIGAIIRRDLDYSDELRLLQSNASYRISAQLVSGKVVVSLVDNRTQAQQTAEFPVVDSLGTGYRAAVHQASDRIVEWVTGRPGMAASRILYVQGGKVRIVDSDGFNDHPITNGNAALSPAWHPSGKKIVYSDLADQGTQIAELDLTTGKTSLFDATPRGLNITPVFTRDGASVVYASGGEEPADLVLASDQVGSKARKMGTGGLLEQSSPSFSPDGRRLAFIAPSPRTPQIFTMNIDGSDIRQLTPTVAGVRSYRTGPDWSPDGNAIAYEQQNGDFQVWMITLADRKMRKLTSIGENEDPSWAPDARHLVLTSTRHNVRNLWVLDTRTGRMRQLTYNDGARLAAWSPALDTGAVASTAAPSYTGNMR